MSWQLAGGDTLRRLVSASRWVFGPAALLFLIVAGWRARELFASVLRQTDAEPLILAVLLWALLHLLTPVFSCIVLRETGADIGYRTALGIHVGRLPARYLPGGIWHTVSRVVDLHRIGVSRAQLTTMLLLENLVPVAVAATLGGVCLGLTGNLRWPVVVTVLGGLLLLAFAPLLLRHCVSRLSRQFTAASYFKLVACTAVFWILAATSFYYYWSAFPVTLESVSMLQIYGVYLLAWTAGFVSVFAPQGLGVFESVAALFLRGTLGFAGVATLAAGFRIAILAADALAFSALQLIRHGYRALRR